LQSQPGMMKSGNVWVNRVGPIKADHRVSALCRLRFNPWLSDQYGESPKRLSKSTKIKMLS